MEKLGRHLVAVHPSQVKSAQHLEKLCADARRAALVQVVLRSDSRSSKLSSGRAQEIFGKLFYKEDFRHKLSLALSEVGSGLLSSREDEQEELGQEELPQENLHQDSDEDADLGKPEENNKSTKSKIKSQLGAKDETSEVYRLFKSHMEVSSKTMRTAKNKCSNLARYLGFANQRRPNKKSAWELMVDTDVGQQFMKTLEECEATPATIQNYINDITAVLEEATRSWSSKVPKSTSFKSKISDAKAFWGKMKKRYSRKTTERKNKKLSTGNEEVVDLRTLYAYINDTKVKTNVDKALARLKSHAKTRTPFKITRKDPAESRAWNLVISYLIICLLVTNVGRTGDLQNFTMKEFKAAKVVGPYRCIFIASHKTSDKGVKSLMVEKWIYTIMNAFAQIREKMQVESDYMFVTTGGQQFRTVHEDINEWRRQRDLPPITTNMIRSAVQTAAEIQDIETQKAVSSQLSHQLATAQRHYRHTNVQAAVQKYEVTRHVQNNGMALSLFKVKARQLFPGEEMPSFEEVEITVAYELQLQDFKLSDKTYESMKTIWMTVEDQ